MIQGIKNWSGVLEVALLATSALAAATPHQTHSNTAFARDKANTTSNVCNGTTIPGLPKDAWDSHLHIIDPDRYPLLPDAAYKIGVYTVWDNAIFERRIGCEHVVMVQPSVYGTDNTLLIESLKAYGPARGRGVVQFDVGNTSTRQLQEWHGIGVRGVRINLKTHDIEQPIEMLKDTLRAYADAVRPLGWVIQMYVPMKVIAGLETFISTLDIRVVFDHFGSPTLPEPKTAPCITQKSTLDPYTVEGFASLVRLLQQGQTWVKVSGAYRLSKFPGPEYSDVDQLALEMFRVAPSRLVYGSDWPHTRFEGLDIQPWVTHLVKLTGGNTTLQDGLFRDNARELWNSK